VDDILKLSRLDEKNVQAPFETVGLKQAAAAVLERLAEKAKREEVTLSLEGQDVSVSAVPQMLDELIFNLCDNAIKYNKKGGRVTVRVAEEQGFATLEVSDTGIRIPAADQARVFERFYRVDKSRSKLTGGTGLGLSIVKHIAEYHKASVSLESKENVGTKITVRFSL
jgi:two-component system phosphate regulon sensor histidine kinase PhoR